MPRLKEGAVGTGSSSLATVFLEHGPEIGGGAGGVVAPRKPLGMDGQTPIPISNGAAQTWTTFVARNSYRLLEPGIYLITSTDNATNVEIHTYSFREGADKLVASAYLSPTSSMVTVAAATVGHTKLKPTDDDVTIRLVSMGRV